MGAASCKIYSLLIYDLSKALTRMSTPPLSPPIDPPTPSLGPLPHPWDRSPNPHWGSQLEVLPHLPSRCDPPTIHRTRRWTSRGRRLPPLYRTHVPEYYKGRAFQRPSPLLPTRVIQRGPGWAGGTSCWRPANFDPFSATVLVSCQLLFVALHTHLP